MAGVRALYTLQGMLGSALLHLNRRSDMPRGTGCPKDFHVPLSLSMSVRTPVRVSFQRGHDQLSSSLRAGRRWK